MKKYIKDIVAVCCLIIIIFVGVFRSHTADTNIIGNWVVQSGGFDDKISFLVNEKGEHVYQSWLDDRPSDLGKWKIVGKRLTIVTSSGSMVFDPVVREDEKLILRSITAGVGDGTYVILK